MDVGQVEEKVSALFEAEEARQEWERAVELVLAARNAEVDLKVRFLLPNATGAISQTEYAQSEQAIALIVLDGRVYYWQPVEKAAADAFFLE